MKSSDGRSRGLAVQEDRWADGLTLGHTSANGHTFMLSGITKAEFAEFVRDVKAGYYDQFVEGV